ncbi:hypothetical protein TWF694_006695 [Orbilia ellipsospora]|uniref:Peptidase A1 domain-containing protein n=1 Tax=Orbilia ellipsospora TaxID=2528407 RepID=A0AAV9XKV5_9PEZI
MLNISAIGWVDDAYAPGEQIVTTYFAECEECFQTADSSYALRYSTQGLLASDIMVNNTTFVKRNMIRIVNGQNPRMAGLDGLLGLGRQGHALQSTVNFTTPLNVSNLSTYRNITRSSYFWKDTGFSTFATYFVPGNNTGAKPVLQFNVDENYGDTSKYYPVLGRESLPWFNCNNTFGQQSIWLPQPKPWNLLVGGISVDDTDYDPRVQWQAINGTSTIAKLPNGATSFSEVNTNYSNVAIFDSTSQWTRLHPNIVDRFYQKIPRASFDNGTYYVPCDIDEHSIPKLTISFEEVHNPLRLASKNARPGLAGVAIGFEVNKKEFVTKSSLSLGNETLCAGALQSIHRNPYGSPPSAYPDTQSVDMLLGQWAFKGWYLVFKWVENPVAPDTPWMIGIAQIAT